MTELIQGQNGEYTFTVLDVNGNPIDIYTGTEYAIIVLKNKGVVLHKYYQGIGGTTPSTREGYGEAILSSDIVNEKGQFLLKLTSYQTKSFYVNPALKYGNIDIYVGLYNFDKTRKEYKIEDELILKAGEIINKFE